VEEGKESSRACHLRPKKDYDRPRVKRALIGHSSEGRAGLKRSAAVRVTAPSGFERAVTNPAGANAISEKDFQSGSTTKTLSEHAPGQHLDFVWDLHRSA
jgi:hypothetical protein